MAVLQVMNNNTQSVVLVAISAKTLTGLMMGALQGSKATLKCDIPDAKTYTWYFTPAMGNPPKTITLSQSGQVLTFSSIDRDKNEGVYSCVAHFPSKQLIKTQTKIMYVYCK
jgi:hypothetical protein